MLGNVCNSNNMKNLIQSLKEKKNNLCKRYMCVRMSALDITSIMSLVFNIFCFKCLYMRIKECQFSVRKICVFFVSETLILA